MISLSIRTGSVHLEILEKKGYATLYAFLQDIESAPQHIAE
jgi:hypothetical protein